MIIDEQSLDKKIGTIKGNDFKWRGILTFTIGWEVWERYEVRISEIVHENNWRIYAIDKGEYCIIVITKGYINHN